ncbi:MAG: hypothetical protein SGBAC_009071 [Bacillariaceae sp.]
MDAKDFETKPATYTQPQKQDPVLEDFSISGTTQPTNYDCLATNEHSLSQKKLPILEEFSISDVTKEIAKRSLYSPAADEPRLFGDNTRINEDGKRVGHGDFYSRFPTMEEVSKYASDITNGLYQPKNLEENAESDEITVTTQYLTFKSLCSLPNMSSKDIASWAYVMSAFQANSKNENVAQAAMKSEVASSNERELEATRDGIDDESIPCLYNSDDESVDDDSVVLDIDAPVEEIEALEYIDAMEAAALELEHPECFLHVVAHKEQQGCHIGILFARQTPTSPLIIHRVGKNGIFSSSDLLPGMVVREINRRPMSFGVGPEEAFLELKGSLPGEVSILAEGLVCTVQRLQRKLKIGLKLKETQHGKVIISKITNKSIFKDTELQPGMTIQSINGQLCPSTIKAARFIMKETIGSIQIVAIDHAKMEKERLSMVESGKIAQLFQTQNKISVSTQEISGDGQESSIAAATISERIPDTSTASGIMAAPIQSETSILLNGDGMSASRFEVTVTKQHAASNNDQTGISFSRMNDNAPLTIETIDKAGLFGQTSTCLVEGMVVVSINGEAMTWNAPNVAETAVATSNTVTIAAEAFVTTVIKADACERVGMTLKKTTNGGRNNQIYIHQIPIGSKFAATALQPGMVLLTINGKPCPKTIKETRALFASVGVGELTIMAVNVDRRRWSTIADGTSTQLEQDQKTHHVKKQSDEILDTLNALAVSSSNSASGMIFGNESTEEEGAAAQVLFGEI